jgi:tRNA A-37 threonylcarbamoyl transferase component Bud32
MKRINQQEYDALVAGSEILEEDANGLKVVVLSDGTFLKLFRIKGFFSSTWYRPHATRFSNNVADLKSLRIPVPKVLETYWIGHLKMNAVQYIPLNGQTIRNLYAQEGRNSESLVKLIAEFIAQLHQKGVYFHSLHLGNILMLDDGTLGLIDVSDMKIYSKTLNADKRLRNFTHLIRYKQDRTQLEAYGRDLFVQGYADSDSVNEKLNQLWDEFESGQRKSKR